MTARLLLVVAVLLAPGCIAWRSDAIGTTGVDDLPPFTGEVGKGAGSLSLVHALWNARFEGGRIVERTPTLFQGSRHELALRYAGSMLKSSGYFRAIKPSDVGGDLHLDIAYTVAPADPSWWYYTSRFLLQLLPATNDTRIELSAVVERDGQVVKKYHYAETLTEFRWLPCIVLMPFTTPATTQGSMNNALYRALIHDLAADGVIPYRR